MDKYFIFLQPSKTYEKMLPKINFEEEKKDKRFGKTKKKKRTLEGDYFCPQHNPNFISQFSFVFSLQIGEIGFWRALLENT